MYTYEEKKLEIEVKYRKKVKHILIQKIANMLLLIGIITYGYAISDYTFFLFLYIVIPIQTLTLYDLIKIAEESKNHQMEIIDQIKKNDELRKKIEMQKNL